MSNLQRLVEVIAQLRGPGGCPWDREQTHASMRPYLLEEVYEVLDAIDAGQDEPLAEELGDLLFVVLLLAQIGQDEGRFSLDDVAARITDKMIVRHPHVFDPQQQGAPGGTIASWEQLKAKLNQKKPLRKSRLDGVPRSLPALLRAFRQAEKASAVGFDWPDRHGVLDKINEELGELDEAIEHNDPEQIAAEYGDLLLAVANLGRHIGATPEESLRSANDRFAERFGRMEAIADAEGVDLVAADDAALDALWERAKRDLRAKKVSADRSGA